jgi:spermidine synthase
MMAGMSSFFEELDFQVTPLGAVSLRRKRIAMLQNQVVYEVKLGDAFLMSSLFHAVEDALADLALEELGPGAWDVVVGGLGLGYTAAAALAHASVRSLRVVEFLPPVIGWHERGLVPLGEKLTSDPRCRFVQGDFFALSASPAGFEGGRRYHAILLDIDHSPHNLLDPRNAAFYSPEGLNRLAGHLHPEGIFAMWSDDPPDQDFLELLCDVFGSARAEVVRFPNPFLDRESASTVYLARKVPGRAVTSL